MGMFQWASVLLLGHDMTVILLFILQSRPTTYREKTHRMDTST